jgi:hypothetical protein
MAHQFKKMLKQSTWTVARVFQPLPLAQAHAGAAAVFVDEFERALRIQNG